MQKGSAYLSSCGQCRTSKTPSLAPGAPLWRRQVVLLQHGGMGSSPTQQAAAVEAPPAKTHDIITS